MCSVTGANELLAAYSAGISLAALRSDLAQSLVRLGEPLRAESHAIPKPKAAIMEYTHSPKIS